MLRRLLRHLLTPAWAVDRVLPARVMASIQRAIERSEATHRGEVRFAVEAALGPLEILRGVSARDRAIETFARLGVWDTEENNGVLIYLLLADRDFEIVADRGIHGRVGSAGWESIARSMEGALRAGRFEEGIVEGIAAVGEALARHYPGGGADRNQLPDRPIVV
jgi:uncharacterized membrane protein